MWVQDSFGRTNAINKFEELRLFVALLVFLVLDVSHTEM